MRIAICGAEGSTFGRSAATARLGLAVVFFLTGAVFASWASRIPAVKADLALSNGELALAFIALNAGAVIGLQAAAVFVPRAGSRAALQVAFPAYASALAGLGFAPDLATSAGLLVASAAANSIVDVAMNTHGVAVEQRLGRPILSGLHAMFSIGTVAGASAGALAAQLHAGIGAHFLIAAGVCDAVGIAASFLLLPTAIDSAGPAGESPRLRRVPGELRHWPARLIVLGALAFCVILAEGSAQDWSAVYLRDSLDAPPALAAAGFTVFTTTMALGRLAGDRLTARFNPVTAFRAGTLIAGIGFGGTLLIRVPAAGLAGFALLGAGISYTFPLIVRAAGRQHGTTAGSAVARVSTVGYLGSFTGPALIGALAGTFGLPAALALPALLAAGATLGARAIAPAHAALHVKAEPAPPTRPQAPPLRATPPSGRSQQPALPGNLTPKPDAGPRPGVEDKPTPDDAGPQPAGNPAAASFQAKLVLSRQSRTAWRDTPPDDP
jgi:fucose permease